MPVAAERTTVSRTPALDSGEQRRIERIRLRAIAALARAHALTLVGGGFLHRGENAATRDCRKEANGSGVRRGSGW